MILNGVMAVTLRYFTEFGKRESQHITASARIELIDYKMLSCRRETALQGALYFWPKVEDWNWETIFYGHYRSIFNHSDTIGLKSIEFGEKKAK